MIKISAALMLVLGAGAASAQSVVATVTLPCVTPHEAEALVAAVVPELIGEDRKSVV